MMSCKASSATFVPTKPGYGRPRAFTTVRCAASMPAGPQEVKTTVLCYMLHCEWKYSASNAFQQYDDYATGVDRSFSSCLPSATRINNRLVFPPSEYSLYGTRLPRHCGLTEACEVIVPMHEDADT